MILKLFFNDAEIAEFFRSNGFKVETREFGDWSRIPHNDTKYNEYDAPAVIIPSGDAIEASKLFERVMEKRKMQLFTPSSSGMKKLINTIISSNELKKS